MSTVKQMTAREEIKALKAKIGDLQKNIVGKTFGDKLTVKVTNKGGLSVYGLGKYPVTLYLSQLIRLEKLLASADFKEFVQVNNEKIAKKAEEAKAE